MQSMAEPVVLVTVDHSTALDEHDGGGLKKPDTGGKSPGEAILRVAYIIGERSVLDYLL